MDFFNSLDYLEPRCPKCSAKLDYGVNTSFDDSAHSHVCTNCGKVLE